MNTIYYVVDKKTGTLLSDHETRQEAWSAWQECWMNAQGMTRFEALERYVMGKAKNMTKYIGKAGE